MENEPEECEPIRDEYAREQLLKARQYADAGRYRLSLDCARRAIDSLESIVADLS